MLQLEAFGGPFRQQMTEQARVAEIIFDEQHRQSCLWRVHVR